MALQPTLDLYAATKRRSRAAALATSALWGRIPPGSDWTAEWTKQLRVATALVAAAQFGAASDAIETVPAELEEAGYPERQLAKADPRGFVGWMMHEFDDEASPLDEVLMWGPLNASRRLHEGASEVDRLDAGRRVLEALTRTSVTDASREAASAQGVATARTVAAWYDPPPFCQRCAVLIGKRVRWDTQFRRHPQCDGQVQHISERDHRSLGAPSLDDIYDLTEAQRSAVKDGADLSQVVNAANPKYRVDGKTTTYGTRRRKRAARLTPKAIYAQAKTREEAVQLLAKNGYIIGNARDVAKLAG